MLSGKNDFTGDFTVTGGTLVIGSDAPKGAPGALGNATSAVLTNTTLVTGGAYTVGGDIVTHHELCVLGGQQTIGTSTFSGTITLGYNAAVTAATGGRVDFTGVITDGATGKVVTKTGGGIVALSGSNSYGGGTAVTEGTLLVNNLTGSGTGTGLVMAGSGSKLGGKGIIGGPVRIELGATLAPGDGIGTLATGALSLKNTSKLAFDLGGTGLGQSDRVSVLGDLTLDGILDIQPQSDFGAGTYDLFSYSGNLIDNGLQLGSVPSGYTYDFHTGSGMVTLDVSTVPEPSTIALLGMSLIGMIGWTWKKRR